MIAARCTRPAAWAAIAIAALLAGCAGDAGGLAQQWQAAGDTGYVAGDGSTASFRVDERADAVHFIGVSEHGEPIDSNELLGSVSVVNFWYAGCAPCRAEAADLVAVYEDVAAQGVTFLGVNTRDGREQAAQFAAEFGVTYPSVIDAEGGRAVQRAFAGQVPLHAVPTTLVLDAEGRVAHRVLGQIAAASQLRTLIAETLAEQQQ